MIKKYIVFFGVFASLVSANMNSNSPAERGEQFYKFKDDNKTENIEKTSFDKTSRTASSSPKKGETLAILKELLKVSKEQRDIQKKIYKLLSQEINPKPHMITVNGVKCIANSSDKCFEMPLTKQAKKIPVLKAVLTNPTPETAKNWLRWYAKYLKTGPFKVGRSFEYAMNTYGEEAYPMNLERTSVNSNTGILSAKREAETRKLINKFYRSKKLGLYIFLQAKALDYFSIMQITNILRDADGKGITLVFKNEKDKKDFLSSTKVVANARFYKNIPIVTNEKYFKKNNIYMTPTYVVVFKNGKKSKKQAIAVGRVDSSEIDTKIYDWLETEKFIKKGKLSDYKLWNSEEKPDKGSKK